MISLTDPHASEVASAVAIAQLGVVVLLKSIGRQLNRIAVSDRTTFSGLTQFVLDDLVSVALSDWHRARCRIGNA